MFVQNNWKPISSIENITIENKVNFETESGLVMANGIMTTGICDNRPDLGTDFGQTHFDLEDTLKSVEKAHLMVNFDDSRDAIFATQN